MKYALATLLTSLRITAAVTHVFGQATTTAVFSPDPGTSLLPTAQRK